MRRRTRLTRRGWIVLGIVFAIAWYLLAAHMYAGCIAAGGTWEICRFG